MPPSKSCCRETLDKAPQAIACAACLDTIVRCTACGAPASSDGLCEECVRVEVDAEAERTFSEGSRPAFGLRVRNAGSRPVSLVAVRRAGPLEGDGAAAPVPDAGREVPPGREVAVEIAAGPADAGAVLVDDLVLHVAAPGHEAHALRALPFRVGEVRKAAAAAPVNVVFQAPVNIGAAADLVIGGAKYGAPPAPEARPGPSSWQALALAALPGFPADRQTPLVDRRVQVLWTSPKTGEEQVARFARRRHLALGRKETPDLPEDSPACVQLRWYPPLHVHPLASEVANNQVSRVHARLEVRGGRLWLCDLSRNGTAVNGQPVAPGAPVALRHGDRITPWTQAHYSCLGSWQVQFRPGPDGFARSVVIRHDVV